MTPIPGGQFTDKRDLATAKAIAVRIQNDILAGNFDPTLDRYRITPKPDSPPQAPKGLLELWDSWVASLDLSDTTKADHYEMVRRMIVKANPRLDQTDWLASAPLAPSTYNKRLGYLRACCSWAVSKGHLAANPYANLKPRKASKPSPKPFTASEIAKILDGFDRLHPRYSGFVRFLLATGVRTGEAIGLTWSHIDFDQGTLTVCESLSIDRTGNGYQKVRKGTKTGSVRVLGLSNSLRSLLAPLKPLDAFPDSLVFTTPTGQPIDAGNFRSRQWKAVLESVGVPYRKPYNTRHTMISHCIDQHIPLTGIAYLAGHRDTRMVMETYGHLVNRPELPKMPL